MRPSVPGDEHDRDTVVGYTLFWTTDGDEQISAVRESRGRVSLLPALPGDTLSMATGLDSKGTTVGFSVPWTYVETDPYTETPPTVTPVIRR